MIIKPSQALFTQDQVKNLANSINFLHVRELKTLCDSLSIPNSGKKLNLINRILHFVKTGLIINERQIPKICYAKNDPILKLTPKTLILKGQYKNDLKTRIFFKNLIGEHFHFTAFGIDWINKRWLDGNPPTYSEFAVMWQQEYQKRKILGSKPKEEWAYIDFVQKLIQKKPSITRIEIIKEWQDERKKHKQIVEKYIVELKKLFLKI